MFKIHCCESWGNCKYQHSLSFNLVLNCFNFKGAVYKKWWITVRNFFKVARHYEVHFKHFHLVMQMFTRSMSHKEVDFVNYIASKFEDLKEKELKEDLLSNITSLINEQSTQIENLDYKLRKQNSTISVLQNNV